MDLAPLLDPLGPFEPAPLLAVGVSGGADSLALALLADRWARDRGGRVVALTVDHRLRPDSAAEAAQVAAWMRGRGIDHHILTPAQPPERRNVQAQARALRHRLLRDWCRAAGALHLLLAHHREDQAETLLLRLARGSGGDGLAGMAAVAWTPEVRVLRPLLTVPRAALEDYLRAQGQAWVSDSSNRDAAYGRVRMRRLLPDLAAEGADAARLAATAGHLGQARRVMERAVGALLARAAVPHAAGYVILDPAPVRAAESAVARAALAAVLAAVGGRPHGARAEVVVGLLERLGQDPVTAGGCRLDPIPNNRLLIARESRAVARLPLGGEGEPPFGLWDGRFRVALHSGMAPGVVAALGADGWRQVRDAVAPDFPALPPSVRATLPALWRVDRVVAVPALGIGAGLVARWTPSRGLIVGLFRPAGFRLASAQSSII